MRHFLRTTLADRPAEERFQVMEPVLELNPEHPIVRYLSDLLPGSVANNDHSAALAPALLEYLFDAAITQAGLQDDARGLASRMNDLITKLVERQQGQSSHPDATKSV